jgi:hypothetical protein
MNIIQKLENKITKSHLDKALESAKAWCSENLPKHLEDFDGNFNYDIFNYAINNEQIGLNMWLDSKQQGRIYVSTEKIKWHQERENALARNAYLVRYGRIDSKLIKIPGAVEVDLESMFVYKITESIIHTTSQLFQEYWPDPHAVAYQIENINRTARGLKPWPED